MNNANANHYPVYSVVDTFDERGRKIDSKWVRIGVMFPFEYQGSIGHTIKFEARPLDWSKCSIVALPPKTREDGNGP